MILEAVFGLAVVIDGDTIKVNGERVRLFGIDAPEASQTCETATGAIKCGDIARVQLARRIGGRPVRCEGKTRDRYKRLVAVCTVSGDDLGSWMVRSGWATAYRRYSVRYATDEAAAKSAKLGIWATSFIPPATYRRSR